MKPRLVSRFLVLALVLSACLPGAGPSSLQASGPRVWFDAPLPGTVVSDVGACEITAHGASAAGFRDFEFLVDDAREDITATSGKDEHLVTYQRDCSDFPAGQFALRLRAQDGNGKWSNYADTSLTIISGPRTTPSPPPEAVATPTRTPLGRGGMVIVESVSSNLVYAGDETCGPVEVSITARATAPAGITVVVLFYRVEPGSPAGYQNLVMESVGRDRYQGTISPNSVLDGPAEGLLQYQVVVQQSDGDTSIRTPLLTDIAVQPCGQVVSPGGATPSGCSRYGTQRSCESHGCRWVLLPAIFPVYACGNP